MSLWSSPAPVARVARISANSPRFCSIALALNPSAPVSLLSQAISCPPRVLITSVITTATATGQSTLPKVEGLSVSPKLRKKNAPKMSRIGSASCSMRSRYLVAPSTRPIRNAPIASDTPSSSPIPPKATARPKNKMVNSSSSLVWMSLETTRPPQRASANMATRKVNEMVNSSTIGHTSVLPPITTATIAR